MNWIGIIILIGVLLLLITTGMIVNYKWKTSIIRWWKKYRVFRLIEKKGKFSMKTNTKIEMIKMLICEGKTLEEKGLNMIPNDESEEYAIWANKVYIFNEKYLQNNPLHIRIHNVSQGYKIYKDSYKEIMALLTAVLEMLTVDYESSNDNNNPTTKTKSEEVFVVEGHE